MFPQIGIVKPGCTTRSQGEINPRDDIAPTLSRVQKAGPISESAVGIRQLDKAARLCVKAPDAVDGLRNFLPVRAHILYGRAASRARNACQALHAGKVTIHGKLHQAVPALARGGPQHHRPTTCRQTFNSLQCHVQHKPGKAAIRNQQVAAAAQYEERELLFVREPDRIRDILLSGRRGEPTRVATHAQGRKRRQRYVLLQVHAFKANSVASRVAVLACRRNRIAEGPESIHLE